MRKVHFGDFNSTVKACGIDLMDSNFPEEDTWSHRVKDVTCEDCLKILHNTTNTPQN